MITLGQISHTNPIIDRKAKAFYDFFHYFLSKNEFVVIDENISENHLSILEKIDFRLQSSKIEPSSKRIIEYLKNSDFLDTKNDYISRKGKIKILITKAKTSLQKDLSNSGNLELAKESINCIVNELNGSYNYQETTYLDFCLDELISFIGCKHEYEKHAQEIRYYTKLIVAEFLRRNFSSDELTGTNSLFSKILSKEINISDCGKNLYSAFPLPLEIVEKKEKPEDYRIVVEDFLKNRTLKEQFKGILNYLNNTKYKSTFIVKILNVECENINISYETTKIITKENLIAYFDNLEEFEKNHFEEFISTQNCIFFEKEIEYKSLNDAANQIMRDAENTLSYLSYPNQLKGTVDWSGYMYLSNNKLGWHWRRNKLGINQNKKYDLDSIDLGDLHYKELFELDKLYFRVFTSVKPEDKLFNAWRYIEVLFKTEKYNVKNGDKKRIKDFVLLLISTEYGFHIKQIERLIIELIINNVEVLDIDISINEINKIIKDRSNRIEVFEKCIDYKFVNDLIDKYKNPNIDFVTKIKFYNFLIETLYEQRNYVVHQASICSISLEIFINQIQIIFKRVRNKIIDKLKTDCNLNLTDVIEQILNNPPNYNE